MSISIFLTDVKAAQCELVEWVTADGEGNGTATHFCKDRLNSTGPLPTYPWLQCNYLRPKEFPNEEYTNKQR